LGGPSWFRLGDRDLGTHLERTRRLNEGESLSEITSDFCRAWGIEFTVLPMTDDDVSTWVYTEDGEITFQEYFVHRQCQPRVTGFRFENAEHAHPAPGVIESLQNADLVIICPSNPWVSIDPILAIPGVRSCMDSLPVVAVSPIIGGKAVKGPAAKMFAELGIEPSTLSVFHHYGKMLGGFVLDIIDVDQVESIRTHGIQTLVTNTLMKTTGDRQRLAKEVLEFSENLIN
ncbi:MAG: YvcK family protein, partial [Anaerolineales bacterium]|nr:YvcK family protein [Anaerolineales bacterium]